MKPSFFKSSGIASWQNALRRSATCAALVAMFVAAAPNAPVATASRAMAAQQGSEEAGGMITLATIHSKDGILLGVETVRLTFERVGGLTSRDWASKVRALAADNEFYVILDEVSSEAPPGIVYSVYLTAGATNEFRGAADPRYIGALQFFNAFGPTTRPGRSEAFNVTERIRSLVRTELDSQPLCLWIAPAGTPGKSSFPRIVDIRLVAQR
jgi:hypothetical protein